MAPDERDRIFDKVLARHLRSAAPAREGAGMPGASASQSSVCPDAETLAAYHERSLFPEQLNSLKEHIVSCANCQTILAHLETTDHIPLQAAKEHHVLAVKESEPVMSARNLETVQAEAAPGQSQRLVGAAPPKKSRRALLFRGARWQWLAPAGAIAAGLLVWIALHENRPLAPSMLPQEENKVAQNRAPAAPLPYDSIAVPRSSAPEKSVTLARPQSPPSAPAIANGRTISGATKQNQKLSDSIGARSADSQTDKEFLARKDRERDASADELTAASRADLDAKSLPEELRKKEDATAQAEKAQAEIAQLQNSQSQNQSNNIISPKAPGPGPLSQVEAPRKAKATAAPAPAAPPPSGQAGVGSSYNDTRSLKVARLFSNPRVISSPALNAFWRVGRSGLIEFSKDGGSSWSRQTSGVRYDLLAGSAPSDQVCWIVGRAGAILLTTDGGTHWTVIPPPLTEDLGGIHASDALHATIWNTRRTKSFETSDGGLTWKPVPNP